MSVNIWLGNNELTVVFRNGRHAVLEAYEDYNAVFQGTYEECCEYVDKRRTEYQESLF